MEIIMKNGNIIEFDDSVDDHEHKGSERDLMWYCQEEEDEGVTLCY
jgi:hypothetical protein